MEEYRLNSSDFIPNGSILDNFPSTTLIQANQIEPSACASGVLHDSIQHLASEKKVSPKRKNPSPPSEKNKREKPAKIPSVYDRFKIWAYDNGHGTLVDTFNRYEEDQVWNVIGSAEIPFGKFKGKSYYEIWKNPEQREYLTWLARKKDVTGNVREILDLLIKTYRLD